MENIDLMRILSTLVDALRRLLPPWLANRFWLEVRGKGHVAARIEADPVRSWGATVWFVVPSHLVPAAPDLAVVTGLQTAGIPVSPATFVLSLHSERASGDAPLIVRDLLLSIRRDPVPDLAEYTLLIDGVTAAGGWGSDAEFGAQFRANITVDIPLMSNPRSQGTTLEDIELHPGDRYAAALRLQPDGTGLFQFSLTARISDGIRTWDAKVLDEFRLLVATATHLARIDRAVRTFNRATLVGEYTGTRAAQELPPVQTLPVLDPGRAVKIAARVTQRSYFGADRRPRSE